jgi:flagellin-like hook-associated protein FlgL
MLTSVGAFGTAAQVEADMQNLFELDSTTAPPASFQSAAKTDGNAALSFNAAATALSDVMRANGSAVDGIYTMTSRYDTDTDTVTFRIQHEGSGEVYSAILRDPNNASGSQTLVFSNGVEFSMSEAIAQTTDTTNIDGVRFEVEQGAATSMTFQVGVQDTDLLDISFASMTAGSLGLDTLNVETLAGGQTASRVVSEAIAKVNNAQAQLGAMQSRMEYVESNLATIIENLSAAKGIFLDVDMAAEMTEFTKHQTLMQAGVAMLAQANNMPKELLQLIRG